MATLLNDMPTPCEVIRCTTRSMDQLKTSLWSTGNDTVRQFTPWQLACILTMKTTHQSTPCCVTVQVTLGQYTGQVTPDVTFEHYRGLPKASLFA